MRILSGNLVFVPVAIALAWSLFWRADVGQGFSDEVAYGMGKPDLDHHQSLHIEEGVPKSGHTYFFSVGDFGVAGCQYALERGEHENEGGDGHEVCYAKQQLRMAQAMSKLTSLQPQFVLSLGDNFYVRGVKDLNDRLFDESFENVFKVGKIAAVPWKILLGDHDHRGNITALLRHSDRSPRWRLPALYYSFNVPIGGGSGRSLEILMIDSVVLEGGMDPELVRKRRFADEYDVEHAGAAAAKEHWRWLEDQLKKPAPALRLVAGHRPVVSIVNRSRRESEHHVESRLQELLSGAALASPVVYMHGHDHAFQRWEDSAARITHIGNGVGGMGLHPFMPPAHSRVRGLELKWAINQSYGFAVHELSQAGLNTYLVDANSGRVVHAAHTST